MREVELRCEGCGGGHTKDAPWYVWEGDRWGWCKHCGEKSKRGVVFLHRLGDDIPCPHHFQGGNHRTPLRIPPDSPTPTHKD